jgi:hypothetical protein
MRRTELATGIHEHQGRRADLRRVCTIFLVSFSA